MQLNWRNVFIALAVLFILFYLVTIVNNIATVFSYIAGAFSGVFGGYHSGSHNSHTYDLARLCVLLIFALGFLRLITRRR
jgi:disulfide bond formation protein DsbB